MTLVEVAESVILENKLFSDTRNYGNFMMVFRKNAVMYRKVIVMYRNSTGSKVKC